MLEDYVRRNGLPSTTHFTDDGIFWPRFDCPGFNAMMEKVDKDAEICQRNIEENLGLTHPTVSSILARLEEKKIIYTQPLEADRRFKRVFLAEKNSEMYEQIEEKISAISEYAFCDVSENEQEVIILMDGVKRLKMYFSFRRFTKNIRKDKMHLSR